MGLIYKFGDVSIRYRLNNIREHTMYGYLFVAGFGDDGQNYAVELSHGDYLPVDAWIINDE